ncbi:MAG: glycerophosphodiester phosphodiesterase [Haloarculaceae archaeon]
MDCIAHRGYAAANPENTVPALERASKTADWIEIDARRCGSGEVVVIHDETVDRLTGATGAVTDFSAADLAALDVLDSGAGVPTLAAAFEAVPPGVGLNVELKERGLTGDVLAVAVEHDNDCLLSAFDPAALREASGVGSVPTALLYADDPAASLEAARELGCAAVHPHWGLCSSEHVRAARDAGLSVNAWTIDGEAAAERVRAAGVDGVIADAPRFCGDADPRTR